MNSNDFLNEDIVTDANDMHQDHEVQMARQECYHAAERAIAVHKLLRHVNEAEGLEGWVSAKITLANDYLKTVHDYLEYQLMTMNSPAESNVLPIAESQQGVAEGLDQPREAAKAIQSLQNLAMMKSALTMQQLSQAGREVIVSNAINAAKTLEQSYLQNKQKGNAIFVRALRDEIDNFSKGLPINASFPESDNDSELGDLLQGKLGKVNFQQGVAEGEKWIQKAVNPKTKGDLHKALHVPQDETIPKSKIDKATHSKNGHLRHMAQFAKNVTKEDASAGASSSGSVATVVKGGKGGTNLLGGPEYKGPNPFKKKKSK